MPDTVVGLFRTRTEANKALGKLKEAGYGPDQVSMSTPHARRRGHYLRKHVAGLLLGALLGAILAALLVIIVPGGRAAIFGGFVPTLIAAAFVGALTGGLAGGLLSMTASGDRALYYEQEVESGRILVSVAAADLEGARQILRAAGAIEAAPVEAPLERPRPESG